VRVIFFILIFCLLFFSAASAEVELALEGRHPSRITEVYQHRGQPWLALEDVLASLGLSGDWDAVRHHYSFRSPAGRVLISPGSRYLSLGESRFELKTRPRFIDGRLRVPEDFVLEQLPRLMKRPVYYRNLSPLTPPVAQEQSAADRLFAFLTRRKQSDAAPRSLSVLIDPGHGGSDPGVVVQGAAPEKDVNYQVARKLARALKMDSGADVRLTRSGDYDLGPRARLDLLTESGADLFISLHAQAGFSPLASGISLFVPPASAFYDPTAEQRSLALARSLSETFMEAGFEVLGTYRAQLSGLSSVALPSVRVELGYLSNEVDRDLLTDPQGQERLARAIFDGIRQFNDNKENFR